MSGIINSYTTLVSAVVDYFEDDSTEFKAYIPTAIALAEERLARELDTLGLRMNTRCSSTAANRLIPKPAGYKVGFDFRYVTSTGELRPLKKSTVSYVEDYWPWANTSVGTPKYYSDYSVTHFIVAPTPDVAGDFPLSYWGKPGGVSAAVSTNYYTSVVPDLFYFATLKEQAEFTKNWSVVQVIENKYQVCLQSVDNEGRRERRDGGMEPANTMGNQNTLNSNSQPE